MAVDGILGLAHKIEAKMIISIVTAMQDSQDTMQEILQETAEREKPRNKFYMNHPGFISLMTKRLSTVFSCVEISSKASFLEEMEEQASLTSLYGLLQDIVKYHFTLDHFEPLRRIKFITLLEKLFLDQKHLSTNCLAAFVKLMMTLAVSDLVPDRGFLVALVTFCYLSIHVALL